MRTTETTISGSCNTHEDLGEELDAVVRRFPHEHADDDREESQSCFSNIPIRQNSVQLTGARSLHDNDGVQWLTLLLRVAVIP
jgi:hypothetical protein